MVKEQEDYGALLRQVRGKSGKSMGALARHLGLSTPYLSDVELGHSAPLTSSYTLKAAKFLGVDAIPLLVAANRSRDAIEFKTPSSKTALRAVAAIQQRAEDLTDEQWERIREIVEAAMGDQ